MATYRHWFLCTCGEIQTMSHTVESCPLTYLGYTLRMKTLFRGWPVMVRDAHTRRRLDVMGRVSADDKMRVQTLQDQRLGCRGVIVKYSEKIWSGVQHSEGLCHGLVLVLRVDVMVLVLTWSSIRGFTTMRYINRLFSYLLNYLRIDVLVFSWSWELMLWSWCWSWEFTSWSWSWKLMSCSWELMSWSWSGLDSWCRGLGVVMRVDVLVLVWSWELMSWSWSWELMSWSCCGLESWCRGLGVVMRVDVLVLVLRVDVLVFYWSWELMLWFWCWSWEFTLWSWSWKLMSWSWELMSWSWSGLKSWCRGLGHESWCLGLAVVLRVDVLVLRVDVFVLVWSWESMLWSWSWKLMF